MQSFSLEVVDGVGVITFDQAGSKVNTLNSKLMPEMKPLLDRITTDPQIKACVILSGKKDSFIVGADIEELQRAQSSAEIQALSTAGQALFDQIQKLSKPVVAAIHGACLGGGLELALACHYRVASASGKTSLGLPEVMLGLLPGAGGTQRLPRLIGLDQAMPLIISGSTLKPEKAKRLGLVDYVVPERGLKSMAIHIAREIAAKRVPIAKPKEPRGLMGLLTKTQMGRNFMFKKALDMVMAKTRGLYPAPKAIIDVLRYSAEHFGQQGFQKEAQTFAQLSQTPESKGLISLYFAQNEVKKNPYGTPAPYQQEIAVLGAGLMGAGISLVSVQKGLTVHLKDVSHEGLSKGQQYLWKSLSSRVKRKSMSPIEANQIMGRVIPQMDLRGLERCSVVIEAVFEDLKLKHRVLQEIEAVIPEDAVFASNTSALPISEIAKASKRPHQVCGMHYFSPVEKMPLLEIIVTKDTSKEAAARAVDVGLKQGKTVIVVKDGPGFYTTRILASFMDEAAMLMSQGVDFHKLDRTMQEFGYPVGPVTLMDEVGLDVAYHVGHDLGLALGKRVSSADPRVLQAFLDAKSFGRKSGKGFYLYQTSKPGFFQKWMGRGSSQKPINPLALELMAKNRDTSAQAQKFLAAEDLQQRMALRMINEAVYCLEEGILSRPLDGDIGAVFGLGFPPFHGGPFRYADKVGIQTIVDRLSKYQDVFGERFTPCEQLKDMARKNEKFYKN